MKTKLRNYILLCDGESMFQDFAGSQIEATFLSFIQENFNQSQFTSPIDKWVSVEEIAPSKSGLYLTILAETEDQYIAYYKSNRNTFEIYGLGRVQPVTDMNVTHWQPLPNPPTK